MSRANMYVLAAAATASNDLHCIAPPRFTRYGRRAFIRLSQRLGKEMESASRVACPFDYPRDASIGETVEGAEYLSDQTLRHPP